MKDLRRFLTLLNLHIAGAVALGGLVLFLAVKVVLAFHAAGEVNSAEYQREQIRSAQLQAQMAHLEGLPEKVNQARDDQSFSRSASHRTIPPLWRSWAQLMCRAR